MANGSFYNYVKGDKESNYFGLYCEYTYDQSISGNYTNVTIDVYLRYYSINLNSRTGTIAVNGTSNSFTSPVMNHYPSGGGGKQKIGSTTIKVNHNSDGTKKSVGLSVSWGAQITYNGTWYSTLTASKTVDLPTIPRASSLSLSASSVDVGKTITASISRATSSFKHTVEFYINSTYYKKYTDVGTSQPYTIPDSWYSYMSSSTSCTAYCRITTFSGNTQIGGQVTKSFTVNVPSGVKPTVGTISLDPSDITTKDGVSRNILVKGKNKMTISVSGSKAGAGSSIKSYTYEALSGSVVIAKTSTTETSATLGPFSNTGSLKFRVTVADARNRSSNNSGNEPTWECHDYNTPYFSNFDAYRANQDGSQNMNGTYIQCDYTPKYSSVGSTNSVTVTAHYNGKTQTDTNGSIRINLDGDTETTYKVYLSIIDNYNGTNQTSTITIFGQARILNITSDGTGVAIGKMAENSELLECRWPAKFNDNLTVGISTQNSAPTGGITVHDVRDAEITPDSFGDKNANFYFDMISDKWYSILHMKGWTGNYAAWELAGNAHNSSSDNTLKYRQGMGGTWGDWQTVLTNKNIGSYCLPIQGGTLTGKLALGENLYYASNNTAGLDCRNSDIINANGIYFRDASDSAGESINFYRDDAKWDTLYAVNGALKFHPNRDTSTTLGGDNVYTASNLRFRRGTCTLNCNTATTVTFSPALNVTPTVMLTPLSTTEGVLAGKVRSVSATGFTAILGGSAISEAATFAYLAVYHS